MHNILITGSNGQLGCELRTLTEIYPIYNFYFTDSIELDITKHKIVKEFIVINNIDVIINCAAYTAVDNAESDIEKCNALNHLAVANLSKLAKEKNIKLIQISTDYVFDGEHFKPYVESDRTNPKSIYGVTKLAAENVLLKLNPPNSIIIRTSWLYSSFRINFLKTMLKLGNEKSKLNIIFDQIGTPTFANDLAITILQIIPKLNNKNVELFHYSNEGVCSWYDFAKAIFEINNNSILTIPIETIKYPTPAVRPYFSVLNKQKIKERYDLEIPYWRDSLRRCIKILNEKY